MTGVGEQRREERPERRVERQRREDAAEDAEHQRVDVEQAGDDHQRQEARHDEVLDRVDAEHLERVELLADLARAEVGGDRRAGDAGEDDRGHERRELADRGEHEEAAEAVDRAEQDEEVARLEARRAVAERDRRDQQREPAEPQREQELLHELGAVRVRRPDGRHDRLAGQDHHVADLLQQVLGRQEDPIGCATDHYSYSSGGNYPIPPLRPTREQPMACGLGTARGNRRGVNWRPCGFRWYVRRRCEGVEDARRLRLPARIRGLRRRRAAGRERAGGQFPGRGRARAASPTTRSSPRART